MNPSKIGLLTPLLALSVAFAVLFLAAPGTWGQEVSTARGQKIFKKCGACHSLEAGRHRAGPSLAGVFGSVAASADGYSYSPVMENSGIIWDEASLDSFLAKPREMMPGMRMFFPGLRLEADRAAVISFLKQEGAASSRVREQAVAPPPASSRDLNNPDLYKSDLNFTLKTAIAEGKMVYVGVGGDIEGIVNPVLSVR